MSSVRQIAKRMRLSVATVSRALNNHPEISPETRDRVLKAANEIGYVGTIGKRVTTNIGLVFTSDAPFTEFDGLLLAGMTRGVAEQRFDITIVNLERDKDSGETYTQFFMRKGIRGAVLRTFTHSRRTCEAIAEEGFPSIVVAERFDNPRVNFIYSDSGPDSRRAVEHLIHLGHRRIAFVMNHLRDRDHTDRHDAYRATLESAGIPYDPELVISVPADLAGGKAALNRLMTRPVPPTAIYYADPLACVGAITRAHEIGLQIPEELSIVGFDDADIRFRVWPVLTAVCQNATQLGFEAALWLTRRLTGREEHGLQKQAATFFEVHGTTGLPPKRPVRILPDGSRIAVNASENSAAGADGNGAGSGGNGKHKH
ncbi:LacI family DNA-binding transcriptional regulator [Fontivita pretiosa]|uniref:LacI family DNA-binding transcriptional regulator n=1 Tax=Fontivita pretiosa TaxID=2989684 RepID=UPI003D1814EB